MLGGWIVLSAVLIRPVFRGERSPPVLVELRVIAVVVHAPPQSIGRRVEELLRCGDDIVVVLDPLTRAGEPRRSELVGAQARIGVSIEVAVTHQAASWGLTVCSSR